MDTKIDRRSVQGITIKGEDRGGKVRVVRSLSQYGSGAEYGVHNSSLLNLARGVAERVLYVQAGDSLVSPRKPVVGVFGELASVKSRLLEVLRPTTVVARGEYPKLYNGRKQVIYQRAYESLLTRGIALKDSYVSTFVKAEKINFTAKPDPAPRVIQPRSPRYNLEVGRYLKLFEAELVHGFSKAWGYNVVVKGLNADQVAKQLHDNWSCFTDPCAIGLDASRFDQHVSKEALEYEHSVYNAVFRSRELRKLLEWQLSNRGFGRIGDTLLTYTVNRCRMSGDINTGMGNCLIMSSIVLAYFDHVGITARLANNGDDCVVFCERKHLHLLEGIDDWFTRFGFKLTREAVVDVFERVVFCQSQPVWVGSAYRMVRDPWTAMSKDCVSLLGWDTPGQFAVWRDAIGVCGGELTRGVPVWESFYQSIRIDGKLGGGLEHVYDSGLGFMAKGVAKAVINDQSRFSFYLAFGIDPDLQLAIETSWPGIEWCPPPLVSTYHLTTNNSNPLCLLSRRRT